MWTSYVGSFEIIELKKVQKFENLAFNALHEVCVWGRFLYSAECEFVGDKYDSAQKI